jgi:tetratricopeptide (TPR) repeat protein
MARRALVERILLDDPVRARTLLDDALALHPLEDLAPLDRPYPYLAFAYAVADRPEVARTLLAEYDATPEADHAEEAEQWAAGARGVIALAEDRLEDALASFREFDEGNNCATCAYPWLAETYGRLGEADSVLVNYECFIDLPSADLWYDAGHLPGAYFRLGELYEERGNRSKAMEYYDQFLALWENADPRFEPWNGRAQAVMDRLLEGGG